MTRLKSTVFLLLLVSFLSACYCRSGSAQENGSPSGLQRSTMFSIGPTTHLRKRLDALPSIYAPKTQAVARANAIISKINKSTIRDLRECEESYRESLGLPKSARVDAWHGSVRVTMLGPRFIAMTVTETSFCYPNSYPVNDHSAVVFDMATGELVNWKSYLRTIDDDSSTSDDSTHVAIGSSIVVPSFSKLAIAKANSECKTVLQEAGDLAFDIWPDARRGQLVIQAIGLPHVVQACEEPIGLSSSEAKTLGFSPIVLDAIEQAHRIENPLQKK